MPEWLGRVEARQSYLKGWAEEAEKFAGLVLREEGWMGRFMGRGSAR